MPRQLKITVYHARGLKNTQHIGKQDPYVEIRCGSQTWQSAAHKGAGASATINQSCAFLVSNEAFLDISVVNHNMITSHSVIGSARVGLENVLKSGTETLEVHVTDQKNYGAGTVELRLEMDKASSTVHSSQAAVAPSGDKPTMQASALYPAAGQPVMTAFGPPPQYGAPMASASHPPFRHNAASAPLSPAQHASHPHYPDPAYGQNGMANASNLHGHTSPLGDPRYHVPSSTAHSPAWPPAYPEFPAAGPYPDSTPSQLQYPYVGSSTAHPHTSPLPPPAPYAPGGCEPLHSQLGVPGQSPYYPDPMFGSTAEQRPAYPDISYPDAHSTVAGTDRYPTAPGVGAHTDAYPKWQSRPPDGYPTIQ